MGKNLGIEIKFYDLLPDKGWEIDLDSMRKAIDKRTKAIIVTNPSNPCGSVFTKEHQLEILKLADEYKIPIIADEIYYGLAYGEGSEFHSFGNLTKDVPIISICGISKIYCLPGWRLGWTIVYNNHGYFDKVIDSMHKHSTIKLHPTSIIQGALPKLLKAFGDDHIKNMNYKLKKNSDYLYENL